MDTRFHCVYILTSHDPKYAGWFYIGYSVHPLRRLRQHNGELVAGAQRTSRKGRPWGLVCCVSGFPEDRAALRFEWTWQHPFQANMLRQAATAAPVGSLQATTQTPRGQDRLDNLKGLTRLNFAVGVLHLLLGTEPFKSLALRLNILDPQRFGAAAEWVRRKGLSQIEPSPCLIIKDMTAEELRALIGNVGTDLQSDDGSEKDASGACQLSQVSFSSEPTGTSDSAQQRRKLIAAEMREQQLEVAGMLACTFCGLPVAPTTSGLKCTNGDMSLLVVTQVSSIPETSTGVVSRDAFCPMRAHVVCLGRWFNHKSGVLEVFPTRPVECPLCSELLVWSLLVQQLKLRIQRRKTQQLLEQKAAVLRQRKDASGVAADSSLRGKRNRDVEQVKNDGAAPSKFKTSFANSSRRFDAVVAAGTLHSANTTAPGSGDAKTPSEESKDSDDWLNW